jgi:hypothetical protein
VFLALTVDEKKGGLFSNVSTTTPSKAPVRETTYTNQGETATPPQIPTKPAPKLTPEQVEAKVAAIYRELDALKEDLRKARLSEPTSPARGLVTLSTGNVYETDPDREYLTLRTLSDNAEGVNISGWYLESYVTEERAGIPEGDRLIERWRSPVLDPIVLLPDDRAYLITGEAPLNTSFRENICTGYLSNEEDFFPTLARNCPHPKDELERFGEIELDNDRCYDFVERLHTCALPDEELSSRTKIGGACNAFVDNTFNYNDCVRLHKNDPYFSRDGYWRIYLDERTELWRSKREIIRLMDENDQVVSVLEY